MRSNDVNRNGRSSKNDGLPEIDLSGMDYLDEEVPVRKKKRKADYEEDLDDFDLESLKADIGEIIDEDKHQGRSGRNLPRQFDTDRFDTEELEYEELEMEELELEDSASGRGRNQLVTVSEHKTPAKRKSSEKEYSLSTDVDYSDEDDFEEGNPDEYSDLYGYSEDDSEDDQQKSHLGLKIAAIVVLLLILVVAFVTLTTPGRKILYKIAANFIYDNVQNEGTGEDTDAVITGIASADNQINPDEDALPPDTESPLDMPVLTEHRSEDYVKTYLLFGIEEIDGASNTDSIILVSTNTRDNTIKMTSILRDTYVNIPGYYPNKINASYAYGCKTGETSAERKANGAKMLVNVIQNTYDVEISGYAYVNFNSFEKIIDRLGGIDIELGEKEASYLRRTNYISKPENRTVQTGWNHLNGNQALGYCRVRKVATLGGANNDYGRTVRQRRVLNAIISQYKNSSLTDLLPIMRDCLAYVTTNLSQDQIADALYDVIENKTFTTTSMRLPYEELFYDSGKSGVFNGKYNVTYALVIDKYRDENIKAFHKFLFLDSDEETETENKEAESVPAP